MTIKQARDICFDFADIRSGLKPEIIRDAASLPWGLDTVRLAFAMFIDELRLERETQGRLFSISGQDGLLHDLERVSMEVDQFVEVALEDRASVALANRVAFSQDPATWPPEVSRMLEKYKWPE